MFVDTEAELPIGRRRVSENCRRGAGVGGACSSVAGCRAHASYTPDTSDLLPQGARIIFNMHYHNATARRRPTRARRRAAMEHDAAASNVGNFQLIGAPGGGQIVDVRVLIPAEATGHIERVRFTGDLGVPEIRVFSMTNHMHKFGVT